MAHLILYDGVCGLCSRLVRFVIARDRKDQFRFASLQSSVAHELLNRYGQDPSKLDTFYAVCDLGTDSERLLSKGIGILFVLRTLGGGWGFTRPLSILPTRVLDCIYDFVARHRYRWFGKVDSCSLPDPSNRSKFLDGSRGTT